MQKEQKENPSAEVGLQRRVKRLERICLILCILILLLFFFGVNLAGTVGRIVGTFQYLTEQLDLICQKVDAIHQGVRGLQ